MSNKSEANLTKYKLIQEFANKHGCVGYPAGRGIGHQIMVEEGTSTTHVQQWASGLLTEQ